MNSRSALELSLDKSLEEVSATVADNAAVRARTHGDARIGGETSLQNHD